MRGLAIVMAGGVMALTGCAVTPVPEPAYVLPPPPPPPPPAPSYPPPPMAYGSGYYPAPPTANGSVPSVRPRTVRGGRPTPMKPVGDRQYASSAASQASETEGFEGDFDCTIQGNVVGVPDGATCDLIKQKLSPGCISFRPSEAMLRGVATDVSVAIKRGGSCEADVQAAIRRGDASDAGIAAEQVFTTQLMTAELDGSRLHFDIQRSDGKDPLRNTNNDPVPVWSWKVTPKLASPPGGYWTLKARIGLFVRDLDGNLEQVPGVWQPHNIKVEVKLRDKVADFLAEVAAWITTPVGAITALTTLVTAIAALLAALRKLKKKQETPAQPGSPSVTAPSAAPAPTRAAST